MASGGSASTTLRDVTQNRSWGWCTPIRSTVLPNTSTCSSSSSTSGSVSIATDSIRWHGVGTRQQVRDRVPVGHRGRVRVLGAVDHREPQRAHVGSPSCLISRSSRADTIGLTGTANQRARDPARELDQRRARGEHERVDRQPTASRRPRSRWSSARRDRPGGRGRRPRSTRATRGARAAGRAGTRGCAGSRRRGRADRATAVRSTSLRYRRRYATRLSFTESTDSASGCSIVGSDADPERRLDRAEHRERTLEPPADVEEPPRRPADGALHREPGERGEVDEHEVELLDAGRRRERGPRAGGRGGRAADPSCCDRYSRTDVASWTTVPIDVATRASASRRARRRTASPSGTFGTSLGTSAAARPRAARSSPSAPSDHPPASVKNVSAGSWSTCWPSSRTARARELGPLGGAAHPVQRLRGAPGDRRAEVDLRRRGDAQRESLLATCAEHPHVLDELEARLPRRIAVGEHAPDAARHDRDAVVAGDRVEAAARPTPAAAAPRSTTRSRRVQRSRGEIGRRRRDRRAAASRRAARRRPPAGTAPAPRSSATEDPNPLASVTPAVLRRPRDTRDAAATAAVDLQRIERDVLHPPVHDVDRLERLERAQPQAVLAHDDVAALGEVEAHLHREVGVLDVASDATVRQSARRFAGCPSTTVRATRARGAVPSARTRSARRSSSAAPVAPTRAITERLSERVAETGRRVGEVLHDPPLALRRPHHVDRVVDEPPLLVARAPPTSACRASANSSRRRDRARSGRGPGGRRGRTASPRAPASAASAAAASRSKSVAVITTGIGSSRHGRLDRLRVAAVAAQRPTARSWTRCPAPSASSSRSIRRCRSASSAGQDRAERAADRRPRLAQRAVERERLVEPAGRDLVRQRARTSVVAVARALRHQPSGWNNVDTTASLTAERPSRTRSIASSSACPSWLAASADAERERRRAGRRARRRPEASTSPSRQRAERVADRSDARRDRAGEDRVEQQERHGLRRLDRSARRALVHLQRVDGAAAGPSTARRRRSRTRASSPRASASTSAAARTPTTRAVMSARSSDRPSSHSSYASSRLISVDIAPSIRWQSAITRLRKRARLRRSTPPATLATVYSERSLTACHTSRGSTSRVVRRFSRAVAMLLATLPGFAVSATRKRTMSCSSRALVQRVERRPLAGDREQRLPRREHGRRHVDHEVRVGADHARRVLGPLEVARTPVEAVGDPRQQHHQSASRRSRCPCCRHPATS